MTRLYLPKVIGHRGAAAYAPENTVAGIHTAADLGIEWISVDVKITKDGEAILFHDDDLSRCTGDTGTVAEMTFSDIRELDAGSSFGDSFIGEKIPTLEEALDAAYARNLGVNLIIRPCPGRETETAEVALDIATRIWPEEDQKPLISSVSHVSLETALDMIEEWPRGLVIEDSSDNWQEILEYLKAEVIHIDGTKQNREEAEEYIETQKLILAHSVSDPEMARQLARWGIDSFVSANPDVIRDAVETKH